MMIPHRVHSVHHTDKLLPYGTAKESSICKMCCSRGTQRTHTDVFRTPECRRWIYVIQRCLFQVKQENNNSMQEFFSPAQPSVFI